MSLPATENSRVLTRKAQASIVEAEETEDDKNPLPMDDPDFFLNFEIPEGMLLYDYL